LSDKPARLGSGWKPCVLPFVTPRRRRPRYTTDLIERHRRAVGACPAIPTGATREIETFNGGGLRPERRVVLEHQHVAHAEIAACVSTRLNPRTQPIGRRLFRQRLARGVDPSHAVVWQVERPSRHRHVARQPSSIRKRVVPPPSAVDRMIDDVIDPVVVPAPGFKRLAECVLRPGDLTTRQVDDLMLILIAMTRPERRVADDEIEHIDGSPGCRRSRRRERG